jgi:hypothetical protein
MEKQEEEREEDNDDEDEDEEPQPEPESEPEANDSTTIYWDIEDLEDIDKDNNEQVFDLKDSIFGLE